MGAGNTYHVTVERQDGVRARASSRGHTLTLGIRRGDPTAGLNATETLMASLGACLITNITSLADRMHLQVDGVRVEIDADRRDEPPGIVQIRYCLLLESSEPPDRLEKLHRLAVKWGTVVNTLLSGLALQGEMVQSR
jgi:uncharacterized OsmC-like protein